MMSKPIQFAIIALSIMAAGCGQGGAGRPELVPVSGTVLYNGKPIEKATVSFWHEKAPRPASGITDAEGKYTLMMFDPGDGAMPGDNVVTVTKLAAKTSSTMMTPAEMAKGGALNLAQQSSQAMKVSPTKPEIPEKYSQKSTSPFKENVSATNNVISLQLAD